MGEMKGKIIKSSIALIVLFFSLWFFFSLMYSTNGLILVANETLHVFATKEQAMAWPTPETMAELSPKQSAPVKKCIDVKHYLIYEIELPDGQNGFVLDGSYELLRDGKKAVCR